MKPATRNFLALAATVLTLFGAYAATVVTTILSGASATGAGSSYDNPQATKTYQAIAKTTSGTGTAVITIQGSNDNENWDATPVGSISLTLTTTYTSDSFTSNDRYAWVRANVTTLTGNTPTVTVTRSY